MKKSHMVQSPNDQRLYQPLTLDNGLRVLLVQQQDAEKSAAAMAVNVGHFDDPSDREGLAHFLEHLVFLGSEKFPQSGEYQQFIANNGGSHNAWTGTEHSCFYFDISHEAFTAALERFADMLSAPLFSADAVDKERHAIEAEFSMKLKDDGRRIYQAHKESINPEHPFAKFSVGNLSTLDDRPGQSAQQAVRDFYQQQYSASRMTLTLVSNAPLEVQAQWAQQYFFALPASLPPKAALVPPLYLDEHLGIQLNIQPHKPTQRFVASFALPDIQPWYRYKLVSFLAHLLGDEGPGSLLSHLKGRGLVNSLSAGGGIDGSNYKDFTLAFELTPQGMLAQDEILLASFSYLAMLKQQPFPAEIFAERQKLVRWSFLYQEQKTPLQLASDLAVNLQHYPVEDYVFGDYRMEMPDAALYQHLLSFFHERNLRLMLIAPEVKVDRQARWYHTPYSQLPLTPDLLHKLQQAAPLPDCHLPKANPYLVDEPRLLETSEGIALPQLYYQADGMKLWFKPDADFRTPKGHVFVEVTLPNTIIGIAELALCKLWLELFLDDINEQFYAATTAGLNYNLHVQQHGLTLHCSGLAGNQIALLYDILEQMPNRHFSQSRFDELKRQLVRHWQNQTRNKPITQLFSKLSALLQPLNPESETLAAVLADCTFDDFQRFYARMFHTVHLEALMIGHWKEQDVISLQQQLAKWLGTVPERCQRLPRYSHNTEGVGPIWLQLPMAQDDEALVIYLPARARSALDMALFMLANHLISPEYFHELRTEQQLGYLVGTGYVPMNLRPGMAFYIQSPRADARTLYQATLTFYQRFLSELPELSAGEFQALKQSLASQIRERDNSLSNRAKRIWLAIGQGDEHCALSDQIQQELNKLSLFDFTEFCQSLLAPDYDAIFLATSEAPAHSHMRTMDATAAIDLLKTLTKAD
ncbi:MAG TPA: peptidase M16 [Rheinheimera sp.]|uniref:insulinase family protein n=1 Tax=Rheinheimera sp. TaxID=1869214 RepID=UPI000EC20D05|nr:insulinase family protein [Rheinheimera sp.]HCU64726.1 peptidase M16 [Rheinheimera sp.]